MSFESDLRINHSFYIYFYSHLYQAIPGLLISAPFAILISYLGEKERRKVFNFLNLSLLFLTNKILTNSKALAASKVKILGKDVVATHKIVCAVVLFPFYAFLFTFLNYLFINKYVTQNGFYQFFLTVTYFILWPIYVYGNFFYFFKVL